MFESIFVETAGAPFTAGAAILSVLTALLLGLLVSLTYAKSTRDKAVSQGFLITLIVLPVVIAMIIMLVGSNVARAFSLAGAFSLVRFRSEPGDPKDIAYICITMAVGLATGMGYIGYAALFAVILCVIMAIVTNILKRGEQTAHLIKITVPENLNYSGVFEEILSQYATQYRLIRVRTTDLGSMYRLDYTLQLKEGADQKSLLDELRARNGNMDIALLLAEYA